jgi:hypothetical protein
MKKINQKQDKKQMLTNIKKSRKNQDPAEITCGRTERSQKIPAIFAAILPAGSQKTGRGTGGSSPPRPTAAATRRPL